jgi:septal ring factor EnvC (AmiA/AmiB activator)
VWRASVLVLALASAAAADPRASLARQLADEAAALDTALAAVAEKLALTDAERALRLAAAYRALHATASTDDALATARRRAAARMVVARDAHERALLADELAKLQAAKTRVSAEVPRVAQVALPESLARPVKGKIVRWFGTFTHDRSKAKLSRRGVDIDVEPRSAVVAMADGVVRYAGPIRGLDRGVIVDHGTYFTVMAKLGELAVPVGVPVKRGDPLGHTARHRAYVEVRVKIGPAGLPIDPEPLFAR